jgi:hypothetical protein
LHRLSPSEAWRLRQAFVRFDRDGDGFLSLPELTALLRSLGYPYDDAFIARLYNLTFALDAPAAGAPSAAAAAASLARGLSPDAYYLFTRVFLTLHAQIEPRVRATALRVVEEVAGPAAVQTLSPALLALLAQVVAIDDAGSVDYSAVESELRVVLADEAAQTPFSPATVEDTATRGISVLASMPAPVLAEPGQHVPVPGPAQLLQQQQQLQPLQPLLIPPIPGHGTRWPLSVPGGAPASTVPIPGSAAVPLNVPAPRGAPLSATSQGGAALRALEQQLLADRPEQTMQHAHLAQQRAYYAQFRDGTAAAAATAGSPLNGAASLGTNMDATRAAVEPSCAAESAFLRERSQLPSALARALPRLISEELAYLSRAYALFTVYFGRAQLGGLLVPDVRRALAALGLAMPAAASDFLLASGALAPVALEDLAAVHGGRGSGGGNAGSHGPGGGSWGARALRDSAESAGAGAKALPLSIVPFPLFAALYRQLFAAHAAEGSDAATMTAFFKSWDLNDDGELSPHEFAQGLRALCADSFEDDLPVGATTDDVWSGRVGATGPMDTANAPGGAYPTSAADASALACGNASLSEDAVSHLLYGAARGGDATVFPTSTSQVPVAASTLPVPHCSFTTTDAALVAALADVNGDGNVSPSEFSQLWGLLAAKPLAASAPAALHCATLLLHKLIRARLGAPLAALQVFSVLPAHARPPLLAVLDAAPRFSLSARLLPVLDHSGLGFKHLRIDPVTGALAPVPLDLSQRLPPAAVAGAGAVAARVLDPLRSRRGPHGGAVLPRGLPCDAAAVDEVALWAATGTLLKGDLGAVASDAHGGISGARLCGAAVAASSLHSVAEKWLSSAPTAALASDELGVFGERPPSAAVEVSLLHAVNVPALDAAGAALVVGFRVRCCLFDKRMPVSNLHVAKAQCNLHKEPSRWVFPGVSSVPGEGENDWAQLLVKTDRANTALLFELTVLIRDTSSAVASAGIGAVPSAVAASGGLPGVTEVSFGWAQLDISLSDLLDTSELGTRKLTLPLHAGTFLTEEPFPPCAVGVAKGSEQRAPALVVQVTPLEKLKAGARVAELVRALPVDIVVPTHAARVVRNYQEALADELSMRSVQRSAKLSSVHSPMVRTLLFCAAHQDAMQVLTETWETARRELSVFKRRDGVSGANALVKDLFYNTVMRFYPLLSMATNVLPPLLVGANDVQRMTTIRDIVALSTSPIAVLASDGLLQSWIRGRGRVSVRAQSELGVLTDEEACSLTPGLAAASDIKTYVLSSNRLRAQEGSAVAAAVVKAEKDMVAPTGVVPAKYKLVHKPFTTAEVSFDPANPSLDRLELLSNIHARISVVARQHAQY